MLDISFLGAFSAGLLSFLSPCVLPLVPPYLCFLTGLGISELGASSASGDPLRHGRLVAMAGVFVLGFATVFVALGATASLLGAAITAHFGTLSIVAGILILLMGLHFLGWIQIPLLNREARFQQTRRPASFLGAYLVGLAFAFGWTPCVGPVLAAVLMVAGAEQTAARGAALLFVYALGIGVPFVVAAAFAGPFMAWAARFRRHMAMVEKTVGAGLVVTGILFVTGAMPRLAGWLLDTVPVLGTIG